MAPAAMRSLLQTMAVARTPRDCSVRVTSRPGGASRPPSSTTAVAGSASAWRASASTHGGQPVAKRSPSATNRHHQRQAAVPQATTRCSTTSARAAPWSKATDGSPSGADQQRRCGTPRRASSGALSSMQRAAEQHHAVHALRHQRAHAVELGLRVVVGADEQHRGPRRPASLAAVPACRRSRRSQRRHDDAHHHRAPPPQRTRQAVRADSPVAAPRLAAPAASVGAQQRRRVEGA